MSPQTSSRRSTRRSAILFCVIASIFASEEKASADGAATDAYCRQFYAGLVQGNTSDTYIWTKNRSSDVFKKGQRSNPPLDGAEVVRTTRRIAATPNGAGKTLSAKEFGAAYPHDINDMSRAQTVLKFDGESVMVEGYDPITREVTLFREFQAIRQGSAKMQNSAFSGPLVVDDLMKDSNPQVSLWGSSYYVDRAESTSTNLKVFRWKGSSDHQYKEYRDVPITISDSLYVAELDQPLKDIKPGAVLTLASGAKFEARSVGEHGQGKIFLRGADRAIIRLDEFLETVGNAENKIASPPAASAAVKSIFEKVRDTVTGKRNVELVGRKGFTRTKTQVASLDDFNASKKEVNARVILKDLIDGKYPNGTRIEMKFDLEVKSYVVGEPDWRYYGKHTAQMLLDASDNVENLYKLETLKIEVPGAKLPRVIGKEYVRTDAGDSRLKHFDVSPVEGTELHYKIKTAKGTSNVTVRFPKTGIVDQVRLSDMADSLIANLPAEHADAQGIILLETGEYYLKDAAGLAYSRTSEGQNVRAISMMGNQTRFLSLFQERVRVFWHETGHSVAEKLWNDNRTPGVEWMRAMALDGKFVSGYAMKNLQEDFAETVASYIATDAGRLQPGLRENFKSRFGMLDRIFAVPADAALFQATLRANQVRLGIGATSVALAGGTTALYYYSTK